MLWEDALIGYWLERRRNLSQATIDDYEYAHAAFEPIWVRLPSTSKL